jgi:type IX secretion system PorP/SprF family membrane protein
MRNIKYIFVLVGLFNLVYAQQMPTSNLYTADQFSVNPAFSGSTNCVGGYLGRLSQFSGIGESQSPETSSLGVYSPLFKTMGIGARLILDNTPMIDKTSASFSYIYGLTLKKEHQLRFALSLGFYQINLDFSDVIVEDYSDDIITSGVQNTMTVSNEFSLYYTYKRSYAGLSVPQIFETNASTLDGSFGLKRHYVVTLGTDLSINKRWSIQPSALYRALTIENGQLDLNGQVTYKRMVSAGLGYRTGGGFLTRLGVRIKNKYHVNYAYEFSGSSSISGISTGSHEILLGIRFCKGKDPLVKDFFWNDAHLQVVQDSLNQYLVIQESMVKTNEEIYQKMMKEGDHSFFKDVDLEKAKQAYQKASEIDTTKEEPKNRIAYINAEIERTEARKKILNKENVIVYENNQDASIAVKGAAQIAKSAAETAKKAALTATNAAKEATSAAESVDKVETENAKTTAKAARKAALAAESASEIASEAAETASKSADEAALLGDEVLVTAVIIEKAVKASEAALKASTIATALAIEATKAAEIVQRAAGSTEEVEKAGVKAENAVAASIAAKETMKAAEAAMSIVQELREQLDRYRTSTYDMSKSGTFESVNEKEEER